MAEDRTEGLERLTNLLVLELQSRHFADATVSRLRPLRRLCELSLQCGPLTDKNCLKAISGLTDLKTLAINENEYDPARGLGEDVLRHFAALVQLQVLKLHLGSGSGEGLQHLAGLRKLRFLQLSGAAVTDECIQHLASLHDLRTLMAQSSSITESGARWLADRLPAVTIITIQHVVKSPRVSVAFRRCRCKTWASALMPDRWTLVPRGDVKFREDGWEVIDTWADEIVGPAEIRLSEYETDEPTTAEEKLGERGANNARLDVRVQIAWPDWESASCIYQKNRSQHLTCVAVQGRRVVTLDCEAPPSRFESFRPLFLFVARSVRLGDAAQEGVGDLIEVPTSEIERAAT